MGALSLVSGIGIVLAVLLLSGAIGVMVLWTRSNAWRAASERTGLVFRGQWNGRGHLLGVYQGRRTGIHTYYHGGPVLRFFAWTLLDGEPLNLDLDLRKARKLAPERTQKALESLRWSDFDLVDGELGFSTIGTSVLTRFWWRADHLVGLIEWLATVAEVVEKHSRADSLSSLGIIAKKRRKRSIQTEKNLARLLDEIADRGFQRSPRSHQIHNHPAHPKLRVRIQTRVIRLEEKRRNERRNRWELLKSFSLARESAEALTELDQLMAADQVDRLP